ncbi:thioredoxin [Bowdeniella nasicola]|uniref:Thioredoxin n=1 Tax=Bowdeniella nasicola TaxID=208480 RepID=A0A1H4CQM0_9ACTO|nr:MULTISPECIES: thioredoxin [Bowdeniella]SEA62693.1 thioredoxin [Bowdeniella nasicola]
MSNVADVTDKNFTEEVLQSSKPVLVDFWATWCPPCRMMAPIIDEIANEKGEALKVVKLDTDANPETAGNYGIVSIPTFILFKEGRAVAQVIGGRPKKDLLKEIDPHL